MLAQSHVLKQADIASFAVRCYFYRCHTSPQAKAKDAASVKASLHPSHLDASSFSSETADGNSPQLQTQPQSIKNAASKFGLTFKIGNIRKEI